MLFLCHAKETRGVHNVEEIELADKNVLCDKSNNDLYSSNHSQSCPSTEPVLKPVPKCQHIQMHLHCTDSDEVHTDTSFDANFIQSSICDSVIFGVRCRKTTQDQRRHYS